MTPDPETIAIYVHWPYCARICPYCDFNVYKQRSDEELTDAILIDLTQWRGLSGPRRVTSIHFGGGTPSLMKSEDIKRVIDTTQSLWGLDETCEIALEANPDDEARFQDFFAAGINRLSLGIQTFNSDGLSLLGRVHSGAQALSAAKTASQLFENWSADLIFGWKGQTSAHLDDDLKALLDLEVPHISTYQLTIEPGTAFERAENRRDKKSVPPDQSAQFYDQVTERLIAKGYEPYEVSNFARPGFRSRHNLTYWQGGDYVGVGPGAHGRLWHHGERWATIAHFKPDEYCRAVSRQGSAWAEKDILDRSAISDEYVLMGLRISEGLSLSRWAALSPVDLPILRIQDLVKEGWLMQDGDQLAATPKGRRVLNTITEKLLT